MKMQHALLLSLTLLLNPLAATSSLKSPPDLRLSPFFSPLYDNSDLNNGTAEDDFSLELRRRQNCPKGYPVNCANLNAAGVCCKSNQICTNDFAGHVACCPTGAACSGTIASSGSASTTTGTGAGLSSDSGSATGIIIGGTSSPTSGSTAASTATGAATGPTSANGGIVIVPAGATAAAGAPTGGTATSGAATSKSYVQNPYYPFAYIPTTYANAAACSSAYTSCQGDVASCTRALAGGSASGIVPAISVGVTTASAGLVSAATTYDPAFASSVCNSLSSSACYGLVVEACGNFGTGNGASGNWGCVRATPRPVVAGFMAVGMMGRMVFGR